MATMIDKLVFSVNVDTEKAIAELEKLAAKAKELNLNEAEADKIIRNNIDFEIKDEE